MATGADFILGLARLAERTEVAVPAAQPRLPADELVFGQRRVLYWIEEQVSHGLDARGHRVAHELSEVGGNLGFQVVAREQVVENGPKPRSSAVAEDGVAFRAGVQARGRVQSQRSRPRGEPGWSRCRRAGRSSSRSRVGLRRPVGQVGGGEDGDFVQNETGEVGDKNTSFFSAFGDRLPVGHCE